MRKQTLMGTTVQRTIVILAGIALVPVWVFVLEGLRYR